jgi:fumarylacetoacetase
LKSFIPVSPDSHFPIQNLPYGIFRHKSGGEPRAGIAIGEMVLDLSVLDSNGLFNETQVVGKNVFSQNTLNSFMSLGKNTWKEIRAVVQNLLLEDNPVLRNNKSLREKSFVRIEDVQFCLPVGIGDYTDFYSSKEHAVNVGTMFRGKDNALMPNWLHLPVAYHGRASSIVTSGTDIHRPKGQIKEDNEPEPTFGPSRMLDFELETGIIIGSGNKLSDPIKINEAFDHVFGMVIVNDWSARDIQKWEYVPLGPFLGKNFATSISPWVVTMDALEPFRTAGPAQNPEPMPYLKCKENCSYNINLEVFLQTSKLSPPAKICTSNFNYLYWNICQQIAHHTVNGCNLKTGDLLASGTISGPEPSSYGSMLELTWNGKNPLKLPDGEHRKFLEDGDSVTMTAFCKGEGFRVGFGEVTGKILPAH